MKKFIPVLLVLISASAFSQTGFSKHEISVNGYRNPSVGLEYRFKQVSIHSGYYPAAMERGVSTHFFRAGLNTWFLPVGKKENPSSFFAGVSYLRGFSRNYDGKNAIGAETGFRWMIWKGLNLRVGVIAVATSDRPVKFNPTSGISYSFFIR